MSEEDWDKVRLPGFPLLPSFHSPLSPSLFPNIDQTPTVLRRKRERPNGAFPRSPTHIQRQPTRRRFHNNLLHSRRIHLRIVNAICGYQSRTIAFDEMFGADAGQEMQGQCCITRSTFDGMGEFYIL